MSDFVTRLAQRQLGQLTTVEPRLPSPFAAMATVAPMPTIEELPTADPGAPRFVGVRSHPFDKQAHGVGDRQDRSEVNPPGETNENSPHPRRKTLPKAYRSAREPTMPAHQPMAFPQSAAAIPPVTRLLSDLPAVSPGSAATFPIPVATSVVAAAAPRTERASAHDQNSIEHTVPPPLVETRATIPTRVPARLEVKLSQRGEIAAHNDADAEPPIHVTIGRIEVTALTPAALGKRTVAPRKPAMSLDDYLARRQRRSRE